MKVIDWTDMQIFAAAAHAQSFVLAAQRLGMDHATVGRRIGKLETRIGQKLFQRSTTGVQLTELGGQLLDVSAELIQASRKFDSTLQALTGDRSLRIKAPESIAHYMITPIISGANFSPFLMSQMFNRPTLLPQSILVADDDEVEADITFEWAHVGEMPSPSANKRIRRLMTVTFLPFYTDAYVANHGEPGGFENLKNAHLGWLNGWEGLGDPPCFEPWYQLMRQSPHKPIRVLNATTLERMVTHGQFISLFPMQMPMHAPTFRPIMDAPVMQLDVWLVIAEHVFKIPHLAEPYQDLITVFKAATSGLDSDGGGFASDGDPV